MANSIGWYDQGKRIVLQTFEGKTTLEDFIDMATQSVALLNTVDYPVQLIVDRKNAFFPQFQPSKMKFMRELVPSNQDLVVVVGVEYSVEMISNIIGIRVAPKAFSKSFYVSTMQAAHEILKRERGIEL